MTNANNNNNNNSQEIYAILGELARKQLETQVQIEETNLAVQSLANDVQRVLARSAVLDEVLLELRDNHEVTQTTLAMHLENFTEHQRTTNAALQSLEAINLRLVQIITGNQN